MRNPKDDFANGLGAMGDEEPQLVYASDVQITIDSGGVRLTFTRTRPRGENLAARGQGSEARSPESEIIARVVLPPLAARRLLKLLPGGLDSQQALADEYAQATEREADPRDATTSAVEQGESANDPFLAALAAAEYDDEPYTEEQREAVRAGREAFARGEFATLDDVWRELTEEGDSARVSGS